MNAYFTKLFYCLLLLTASLQAVSQIKFSASISPTQAGKDEYITLTLTVTNCNNVQNITPPALPDFNVVSGPNTTSEQNTINGVTTQSVSLSYILLAKKPGSYKIDAATALINGRTFKSNNVSVLVSKKATGNNQQNNNVNSPMQSLLSGMDPFNEPQRDVQFSDYILRKGESIPEKVSKNMQLKLVCNKTSCYVGEPLLATYKLYSRLRSESSLSKNPSFNGFSVVEMMQQNDPASVSTEELNGKSYNVYTIRKAQLYPLQAGETELESASLDNRITFIKYTGNNGNNYNIDPDAMVTQTVTLSSKPITINVKPLPEAGKPEGFKGAVGNFTIQSSLQKNSFSTDETGKLIITITGSGNMHLLTLPDIAWPLNFEVFDTKLTDNTDNKTVPISGSKTFEIPFSVSKEGNYSIPIINFSFFDPASNSYKIVNTGNIQFSVAKGTGKANVAKETLPSEKKTPLPFLDSMFQKRWLIILIILGVIIVLFIFGLTKEKKEKRPVEENKSVDLTEDNKNEPVKFISHNPLTKTEDCLFKNECELFYAIINEEMKSYLSKRFNLPVENINNKTLSVVMDKAGIDNEHILQTNRLIQDIEWQLYTPFERNEAINEMYKRAQNIVQILNA
jgi:hypothetical protein